MFGKKEKNTTEPQPVITARIETMPGAFYGGSDPIIYAEQSEKNSLPVPSISPKKPVAPPPPLKKPLPPPDTKNLQKSSLQKPVPKSSSGSHKKIILIVVVLLALGLGVFAYFVFFAPKPPAPVPQPPVSTIIPFEPSPLVELATTSSSSVPTEVVTSTASSTPRIQGGGALILPRVTYSVAKDDDADSLTNSEEEIFSTDPEVWDTDSDGYYDGQEAGNLYNPKGIAPQKIIDSGLVKEYINPTYQYRFYYPAAWRVDAVGDDLKDILVSAESGDYIEIRVFPKDEGLSFASWFATTLSGENFGAFSIFENRFKVSGYKRADTQVGFFETPKAIYSVVYFYGEQEKNAFSHIMNIVLQSFRPSKNGFELPAQIILPGVVSSSPVSSTPNEIISSTTSSTSVFDFSALSNTTSSL